MIKAKLSFALRLLLGLLFIIAALSKIADPVSFLAAIWAFKLVPDVAARLMAVIIPWFELFLGVFLFAGIFYRTCAFALAGLLSVFTIAIITVMIRGYESEVSGIKQRIVFLIIGILALPGIIIPIVLLLILSIIKLGDRIIESTESVTIGSEQGSVTAQQVSQGASSQASATEEIASIITALASQSKQDKENADRVNFKADRINLF